MQKYPKLVRKTWSLKKHAAQNVMMQFILDARPTNSLYNAEKRWVEWSGTEGVEKGMSKATRRESYILSEETSIICDMAYPCYIHKKPA